MRHVTSAQKYMPLRNKMLILMDIFFSIRTDADFFPMVGIKYTHWHN